MEYCVVKQYHFHAFLCVIPEEVRKRPSFKMRV